MAAGARAASACAPPATGSFTRKQLPPASGETTRAERIEELLELMGSGDLGVQVLNGMLGQLQPLLPQVPREWWDEFAARVDPDDINELVIPIYEKHFSDAEIDAMLEFYGSPTGRSIVKKLPLVTQESMIGTMTS